MADLPTAIGRYEVISRLGQGGMGSLYLAKDPKIGRLVAIKLVRQEFDSPEARQRFAREAQSAGTLRHPNIVTIFDVDEHETLPYIAMEYVDGETLGEMIKRKAPIALPTRIKWVEDLCTGLAYAHRQGVVHRDIKPANLMVDTEGNLKILDFGLARREASKFTQSHVIIGTPNYMSPEQIRAGDIGPRSDIFAVGALLYEVVSYAEAFPGNVHQAMHKILYERPTPLEDLVPGIDRGLVSVIDRALEKEADRRYQDLALMRTDLVDVRQRLERSGSQTNTMTLGGAQPTRRLAGPSSGALSGRRDYNPAGSDSSFANPTRPTPLSSRRVGTNRISLQKRRVQQIEQHLTAARAAFESGDLGKARESVEQALMFDTEHPQAVQLFDEIAQEEERRQLAALVASARAELQKGLLDEAERIVAEALQLAPHDPEVQQLRSNIETTRRELERARQVQETLRRARARFAEGAFEVAIRTAGEVLALDPENAPARDLQARAQEAIEARERKSERDAAAQAAVTEARELFERGDKDAAIARLEAISPPHDLVSAFLASLRGETVDATPLVAPAAGEIGPETGRYMPGRSVEGSQVESNRKTMYAAVGVAAAIVLAVVAYVMTRPAPAPPPAPVVEEATVTPPAPAEPIPPPPVVTPPASLATPPTDETGRELREAYRLLALGQRPAAEKIAAQIRRRDAKNPGLAELNTAIQEYARQEKARADAIEAAAAAAREQAAREAEAKAAAVPPPTPPKPAQPEEKTEPVFSTLPGGGFVASSEPPAPALISEVERPAIEASIREYAQALSNKDLQAVSRVRRYTATEAKNWQNAFRIFEEYRLIVKVLSPPTVENDNATILVEETVSQTQKRGGMQVFQNPRQITYKLQKIGGKWMILAPGS